MFEKNSVETIVVSAGGRANELVTAVHNSGVRKISAFLLPGVKFNRSLALNIAASRAVGEYLFLLDADIMIKSDVFAEASSYLREDACFVAIQHILESDPHACRQQQGPSLSFLEELTITKELLTIDGKRATLRERWSRNGDREGDGLVLLRRSDFIMIQGLNSRLTGYGYEDTDFQTRLQLRLGLNRVECGEVVHQTHTGAVRDPEARNHNMWACAENYNAGNYMGTLPDDILAWKHSMVELSVPAA